jgi:TolB-like protein
MSEVLSFREFRLDLGRGVLAGPDGDAVLRPRVQSVLTFLARNPGRVLGKAELMDAGWPDVHVTEDSLTQCIREIRKVLGDEAQRLVRTVARRGYMLAAEAGPPAPARPLPTVAVLRLRNLTGDGTLTPLIDGLAEDLIFGLARFGTVSVLARHSSFAAGDSGEPAGDIARRLGADYLVEGSVRGSGGALRVTASLVDATALQVWSDRFDLAGENFFTGLDMLADTLLGRLSARLDDDGARRAQRRPPASLAAYELMLRGVAVARSNDPARYQEADALLRAAVAADPASGLGLAHLAFVQTMIAGFGRAPRGALDLPLATASRAIDLAPDQPAAYRVLSFVQMYRREYDAAERHLRHALSLNPCDAESVEQLGYLLTLRGRADEALAWHDRSVRLNPIHPNWYEHDRAFALYQLGRYDEAAAAIRLTPSPPAWMQTWLAACLAQQGETAAAAAAITRVGEIDPGFSAAEFAGRNGAAFEHAADARHFREGVNLALDAAR